MTKSSRKLIAVLVTLEVVCSVLLVLLFKLVSKALDLHQASKDKILKSHAAFLGMYLLSKFHNNPSFNEFI